MSEIQNSSLEKEVKVNIPAAEMNQKFEAKLIEATSLVRMPGYRPGKAPKLLVIKQFGDSIYNELVQDVIKESVEKEMKDLNVFGDPELKDLERAREKDLSFTLKFELMPEIKLPDFKEISVEKPAAQVQDKDIDKEIQNLLKGSFDYTPKSDPAEKTDRLLLDITKDEIVAQGIYFLPKDVALVFSKHHTHTDNKDHQECHKLIHDKQLATKLQKSVIGKKIDDTFDVTVSYPDDVEDKSLAGKKVKYHVKVCGIDASMPAELNDEFAKRFGYKSVKELKEGIKKFKETAVQEQVYTILSLRLFNKLEDVLDFEVPPSLLDREYKTIFDRVQKVKDEDEFWKDKKEKELVSYSKKFASRRARIGMALNEYARQKDIEIDNKDLEEAFMREIRSMPLSEQAAAVNWFYKNPENIKMFSGAALERKVVKFILENEVQTKEKPCKFEDLEKILDKETENKLA